MSAKGPIQICCNAPLWREQRKTKGHRMRVHATVAKEGALEPASFETHCDRQVATAMLLRMRSESGGFLAMRLATSLVLPSLRPDRQRGGRVSLVKALSTDRAPSPQHRLPHAVEIEDDSPGVTIARLRPFANSLVKVILRSSASLGGSPLAPGQDSRIRAGSPSKGRGPCHYAIPMCKGSPPFHLE